MSSSNSNSVVVSHLSVSKAEYGKAMEQCGIKRIVVVFLLLDINGAPTKVGPANNCRSVRHTDSIPQRTMHNHHLACHEDRYYAAISEAQSVDEMKS